MCAMLNEELWFGSESSEAAEKRAAASLAARVGRVLGAKPFPASALRLAKLTRDPHCTIDDIQGVLETDPALSARLLRMVNSAGFALRTECTSVRHAAALVGNSRLNQIATTAAIMDMYDNGASQAGRILEHATVVGALSRYLAYYLGLPADELFTCGFLHDIGKLMLLDTDGARYTALLEQAGQQPDTIHTLEVAEFGFDHAMLAGHVLSNWSIPSPVPQVVAWHHNAAHAFAVSAELGQLVGALRLADAMSYAFRSYYPEEEIARLAKTDSAAYLDVSEPQLAAMWDEMVALAMRVARASRDGTGLPATTGRPSAESLRAVRKAQRGPHSKPRPAAADVDELASVAPQRIVEPPDTFIADPSSSGQIPAIVSVHTGTNTASLDSKWDRANPGWEPSVNSQPLVAPVAPRPLPQPLPAAGEPLLGPGASLDAFLPTEVVIVDKPSRNTETSSGTVEDDLRPQSMPTLNAPPEPDSALESPHEFEDLPAPAASAAEPPLGNDLRARAATDLVVDDVSELDLSPTLKNLVASVPPLAIVPDTESTPPTPSEPGDATPQPGPDEVSVGLLTDGPRHARPTRLQPLPAMSIRPESAVAAPRQFSCIVCNGPTYAATCPACGSYVCPSHQHGRDHWCQLCATEFRHYRLRLLPQWATLTIGAGFGLTVATVAFVSSGPALGRVVSTLSIAAALAMALGISRHALRRARFLRSRTRREYALPDDEPLTVAKPSPPAPEVPLPAVSIRPANDDFQPLTGARPPRATSAGPPTRPGRASWLSKPPSLHPKPKATDHRSPSGNPPNSARRARSDVSSSKITNPSDGPPRFEPLRLPTGIGPIPSTRAPSTASSLPPSLRPSSRASALGLARSRNQEQRRFRRAIRKKKNSRADH